MDRPTFESILERMDALDRRKMRVYVAELLARAKLAEDKLKELKANA
jgi:hypothetical protein